MRICLKNLCGLSSDREIWFPFAKLVRSNSSQLGLNSMIQPLYLVHHDMSYLIKARRPKIE